jgi:hypothetical protein
MQTINPEFENMRKSELVKTILAQRIESEKLKGELSEESLQRVTQLVDAGKIVNTVIEENNNLKKLIGEPAVGSHPDEWFPRCATWHHERENWAKENQSMRDYVIQYASGKPNWLVRLIGFFVGSTYAKLPPKNPLFGQPSKNLQRKVYHDPVKHIPNKSDRPIAVPDIKSESAFGSNGGVKCDTKVGPCACGAWHTEEKK